MRKRYFLTLDAENCPIVAQRNGKKRRLVSHCSPKKWYKKAVSFHVARLFNWVWCFDFDYFDLQFSWKYTLSWTFVFIPGVILFQISEEFFQIHNVCEGYGKVSVITDLCTAVWDTLQVKCFKLFLYLRRLPFSTLSNKSSVSVAIRKLELCFSYKGVQQ